MNEQPKSTDLRATALDILTEVTQNGGFLNCLLRQVLDKYAYLDRRDRAFISRLCIGTVERMITLDACIDSVSKVPVRKMKPFIRNLLRLSTYQIYEMDSVKEYAICDEAVKLAKKRKFTPLAGFVNGVLRTLIRERDRVLVEFPDSAEKPSELYRKLLPEVPEHVIYGLPAFVYDLLTKAYPDRVKSICEAFMDHGELPTSVHLLRTDRGDVTGQIRDLIDRGILAIHPCENRSLETADMFICPRLDVLMEEPIYRDGYFMVQDISSAMVGRLLPIKSGDRILELCASPGGKTFHAADRLSRIDPDMHPVIACDLSPEKTVRIEENRAFYHMEDKVRICVWDATKPGLLDHLKQEPFDIVIADVPCSGLGMLGNKPDIRHRLKAEDLKTLEALQREILTQAASYVKEGGTLLYSTCTLNPGENADQMRWFCEHFPYEEDEASASELKDALGGCGYEGYKESHGFSLLPGDYPGEGFYLCRLTRKRSN
ncbi:MAG: 16S rRNA (cytosine(967)-C(5))-methyltransferase RsmB [Lachnospiraceae bacterium]|nr:16S rRNA (cytosine(967)-C(5))-methyltransferase RsmB [Lachnospiraceae bacterium]